MHRRLRRQLEEALGEEQESSPHLRKLFRKIEDEYRRADDDRVSLDHALGLLSDLLQRRRDADARPALPPAARAVLSFFDQAPFAAFVCDGDRKVTAWNGAAERLFGIRSSEAVGRELSMLIFPDRDADRAQARTDIRELFDVRDPPPAATLTPTRTGTDRLCEWTVVPLRDRRGRELGKGVVVQEKEPLSGSPADRLAAVR